MDDVFQSPGKSLSENPFGNLPCFLFGIFYPFNPIRSITVLQNEIIELLSGGGESVLFVDEGAMERLKPGDGVANVLEKTSLDSDQLYDVNLFLPATSSGICISHDDTLFLATSLDEGMQEQLAKKARACSQDIAQSLEIVRNWVKVVSDPKLRYFANNW